MKPISIERVLPNALDAEKAVLGGLLTYPQTVCARVLSRLDAEQFYHAAHQQVYRQIQALWKAKRMPDVLTVQQALCDAGTLEEVGGAVALADMTAAFVTAEHIPQYMDVIEEKHAQRMLIATSHEIMELAFTTGISAGKQVEMAERAFRNIAAGLAGKRCVDVKPLADVGPAYTEWSKRVIDRAVDLGKWLPSLRKPCGQLTGGELVFVVGSTGVGKTVIAQNIALSVAPLKTMMFELELPETLTYPRFLQMTRKLSLHEVWEAHHNDGAKEWEADDRFQRIWLCSTAGLSVEEITRRIEAHNAEHLDDPVRVVIVDYFQLLQGRGNTRYEKFSNAAEECKVAAKQTNAVWIVVSQMQRPGESGSYEPNLHSLKETGSAENSAGLVLGAWRDEDDSQLLYVRVLKNTKGAAGMRIDCNFHAATLTITERQD